MQHVALLFSPGHAILEPAVSVGLSANLSVNLSVSHVTFVLHAPERSVYCLVHSSRSIDHLRGQVAISEQRKPQSCLFLDFPSFPNCDHLLIKVDWPGLLI